jgi:RND family efflux transporter MFP subunit
MTIRMSPQDRASSHRTALSLVAILVVALGVLAVWGIAGRARALADVTRETEHLAVTNVAVVRPTRGASQQEIALPGNAQPLAEAPILARTDGYIHKWYVDIGARVKTGQLLAEIDTPEVDQQLAQARADLALSEANMRLAETTARRYDGLMQTDSVSRQDYDNAKGTLEARRATVESARFNVKRLVQLTGFKQIRAPFDGVITARNIDVGALVTAGTNGKELFHIASTKKLRVFVNVPQVYSPQTTPGLAADLTFQQYPGRRFTGTLVRSSESIDQASRTLLVEIDVENPSGELLPGSYVQAHLKLAASQATVRVPVNALLFRSEGAQVATVDHDNKVRLQKVNIQRDLGTELEVASGLSGDEQVIVNPPDSIAEGQTVRIVTPQPSGPAQAR